MPLEGWQTALAVVGGVAGAVAALWPVAIWYEVRKCERPKHAVVRALAASPADRKRFGLGWGQAAELRRYAPMLIAEVEVEGTMREASSAGFRKIARFIFGGNTAAGAAGAAGGGSSGGEAVAMTSPVRQELASLPQQPQPQQQKQSEPVAMTSPVVMSMAGTEQLPADAAGKVKMSFVMPGKYTASTLPRPNDPSVQIKEVPSHTAAALTFRGHVRSREVVEERKRQLLRVMEDEGLTPVGDVVLHQYHPPFTYGWQRVNEVVFRVKE